MRNNKYDSLCSVVDRAMLCYKRLCNTYDLW